MRSNRSSECSGEHSANPQAKDQECNSCRRPGRLSIVSLGPGFQSYLVPEARRALLSADVFVGYKMYLDLIADLADGKRILASGMRKEVDRCQAAIDEAIAGSRVALVSSGDAGIYGMAGLVFDICRERNLRIGRCDQPQEHVDLFVEVIPGVAAFNSGASILGAPLMHDFAAISLSDHLTPWEVIEKRLVAVASADFVLALYNPRSKSRPELLEQARQILLQHRSPRTPVGIVRQAKRKGEWKQLTTLATLPIDEIDMQSIVIVGNSQTYVWDGWMITPRGYLEKYSIR